MKTLLLDMLPEELAALAVQLGEKAFRGKQLFGWLHKGAALSDMANLPKAFRAKLQEGYITGLPDIVEKKISRDGTVKYLFGLWDGNVVEGVRMSYHHGNSLCISSQVGCAMGCTFCASTQGGCVRDLTAGEMLGFILVAAQDVGDATDKRPVSNVVVMGSGEPLLNLPRTLRFLELAGHSQGWNMAARSISISTCGLPEAMTKLADAGSRANLCLSLHAPDDATRQRIMPIARQYSVVEVMAALRYYVRTTGRRAIIEYLLLDGVNDAPDQAQQLARLLRGLQCHVNLIPYNPVAGCELRPPKAEAVAAFEAALSDAGISCTRRRTLGADIDGACGQLRRRHLQGGCTT